MAGDEPARERWNSKTSYVFAAIGSAVGLGNFWRFPALVAKHGGGMFLVPYVLALFLIGIPMLLLELSIGQKFQANSYDALAQVNTRFKGAGIAGLIASANIVVYYMSVLGWSLVYFVSSFTDSVPWASDPAGYYFTQVLHISSGPAEAGYVVPAVIGAMAVGWVITCLCILRGPQTMSWVVYVSVPGPIIILIILFGQAMSLPGAADGVSYYMSGDPANLNPLGNVEVWVDALGQIFFSLSLGMGIMSAYASYNDKYDGHVVRDGLIIALTNSLISFFAGFVVFGVLGHMSHLAGVPINLLPSAGLGLTFVVFPLVLSTLPAAGFFSAIFFLMIFLLGVDSAFSLVEAIATVIHDNFGSKVRREFISIGLCLLFFLLGIGYSTQGGLYYLDIVDHWMGTQALVLVGFFEAIAVGWFYSSERRVLPIREQLGDLTKLAKELFRMENDTFPMIWAIMIKFVVPLLILFIMVMGYVSDALGPYGGYPEGWLPLGYVLYIFTAVVIVALAFVPYTREIQPPISAHPSKMDTSKA